MSQPSAPPGKPTGPRLRIGVTASFFHADPARPIFKGKTLLYGEESMLQWIMAEGALPFLLPRAAGALTAADLVDEIDGLLLSGGSDMSPVHYGEAALRPEWKGDHERDLYEMELVHLCMAANKPVLGVCRGIQVLNVALGGSLYQDITTMRDEALVHRNWEIYDQNFHDVSFETESLLCGWYGATRGQVNSVHHQGLRDLGRGLRVEARSLPDGVVEAVRYAPAVSAAPERSAVVPFAYGVQWHPEFLLATGTPAHLDARVLLRAFLAEIVTRRTTPPGSLAEMAP